MTLSPLLLCASIIYFYRKKNLLTTFPKYAESTFLMDLVSQQGSVNPMKLNFTSQPSLKSTLWFAGLGQMYYCRVCTIFVVQGFPTCGTRTTGGTWAGARWYAKTFQNNNSTTIERPACIRWYGKQNFVQ
jgi:hypothetical protein